MIPVQVQRTAIEAEGDRAGDGDVVAGGDCFVAQVVVAAAAKVTTTDFPSQLRPTAVLTVILCLRPGAGQRVDAIWLRIRGQGVGCLRRLDFRQLLPGGSLVKGTALCVDDGTRLARLCTAGTLDAFHSRKAASVHLALCGDCWHRQHRQQQGQEQAPAQHSFLHRFPPDHGLFLLSSPDDGRRSSSAPPGVSGEIPRSRRTRTASISDKT